LPSKKDGVISWCRERRFNNPFASGQNCREEPLLFGTTSALAVALVLAVAPATGQKSGGTLRIYNSSNPPGASPHEDTTIAVVMPFMAVYNNLVRFDPINPRNSFDTIIPELATSWEWDATKTKLTFKLRSDVTWHDGKPFTGKDVQCTFHRLNGKEPEYLRRNPRGIWYEHLTEVTLDGDYQVTFNLSQPQPSLLAMLASGYTAVYPCHVSGRDMRVKPIGTGPFKLVEFKSNESIRLAKNRDYWKKDQPYLDAIEWRIVPSRSTRLLAFATGEFDLTQTADVTPPLFNEVKKNAPNSICAMLPTNVTTHMLVNREKPPFDNPELRRAMLLSLDRQAFIDILALGKARLAVNMMPPPEGSWGIPIEELKKLPSYGDPIAQREEARKIMEKLGYTPNNKLKVKVATRDFNTFRDPAVILVDQLNKIHFDAELDVVESSVWYNRLFKKDYSVALNLAGAGIDDPDGVLKMGFACRSEANFSQYCNPEVDQLLDQQSREPDVAKRKATVWKIERILVEDVARPIIFHGIGATCWHPHFKGHVQHENSIYNNWRFEHVWLDK
jgi:peptide/nickel transport system substrate-binding protein